MRERRDIVGGAALRILVLSPHRFYIDRGTPIDSDLLIRALGERGEIVDVVTYPDGEDREYPGVTLHRIPRWRWLFGTKPGFSWKKVVCDVLLLRTAWKLLRRGRYDVVHAGEESVYIAMLLKRVFGVPYVYDMDSSIAQQMVEQMPWLRPLSSLFERLERRAVRGSLATAPVCNALAELAGQAGTPFSVTLYDISQLTAADFRRDPSLRKSLGVQRPLVMYVGNLEPYQGVDLLLDGFHEAIERGLKHDLLVAGGSQRDVQRYRARAETLGIADRTHFIGAWPAARLGPLLMEADILAAPRTRGINTPMKIFPYLHSGRAVLATDLPTHSQILNDGVALLAPPEPRAFGAAMARLADDEALRRRLGDAGRALVEANHTYEAHRGRVDLLYDYLTAQLDPREAPSAQPSSGGRAVASGAASGVCTPSAAAGVASAASTRSSRVSRMSR